MCRFTVGGAMSVNAPNRTHHVRYIVLHGVSASRLYPVLEETSLDGGGVGPKDKAGVTLWKSQGVHDAEEEGNMGAQAT